MLHPEYVEAIETRLEWTRILEAPGVWERWQREYDSTRARQGIETRAIATTYLEALRTGDLFVVTRHFCSLIEHAMPGMPDTLTFDSRWLQAPAGWAYLATPFVLPGVQGRERENALGIRLIVRAVGWHPITGGPNKGGWQFLVFGDVSGPNGDSVMRPGEAFFPISYAGLRDGESLADRIEKFENTSRIGPDGKLRGVDGHYLTDDTNRWRHELRWIYAALYLMAQRFATTVRHVPDRAVRRRAERNKQVAPPYIKVVTLRRLEAERVRDPRGEAPDWQWQWEVRGHWRNQFYAAEGIHKPLFIEAYVKGPPDKPLKSAGLKIFSAQR